MGLAPSSGRRTQRPGKRRSSTVGDRRTPPGIRWIRWRRGIGRVGGHGWRHRWRRQGLPERVGLGYRHHPPVHPTLIDSAGQQDGSVAGSHNRAQVVHLQRSLFPVKADRSGLRRALHLQVLHMNLRAGLCLPVAHGRINQRLMAWQPLVQQALQNAHLTPFVRMNQSLQHAGCIAVGRARGWGWVVSRWRLRPGVAVDQQRRQPNAENRGSQNARGHGNSSAFCPAMASTITGRMTPTTSP